jgi:uncharacterized protein
MTTFRRLELSLLPLRLAISRLAAEAPIPAWATQGSLFSVTRTNGELSIVAEESATPSGLQTQPGWRALKVHGPFAFSEIGVISSLASPLAESKISMFVLSTFSTDYLLIASNDLAAAIAVLQQAGHTIHGSIAE